MQKYDLTRMLDEVRRDEGGGGPQKPAAKQVLTQAQIKAMARARPKRTAEKPPSK
jgi:hypothetical protein